MTRLLAAALLLVAPAVNAQQTPEPPPVLSEGSVAEAAQALKAGEYLWAPEAAPEGPVLLIVSVASQRAVLYRNGVPIAVTTVSTGRPGYATPTGIFTVLEKDIEHYSSLYDNAPMPYMQRLTWGGVALHGGSLPGYPASHGCIRLPHDFARLLFGVTRLGMTVIITDASALPRLAPIDDPLSEARPARADGAMSWNPERAPSGPVSIIVSAADRRVVVLRDGREIGRATITISGDVSRTSAYLLAATGADGPHWVQVAIAGDGEPEPVSAQFWQRFGVDPRFREAVAAVVSPGTTVVVTADSLVAGGPPVEILESAPD